MTSELVLAREELAEPECLRLLQTVQIGRIGLSERALPMILPVHFFVRGREVVTSTFAGGQVSSADRGDIVVFEADSCDPVTREGWVVNVIGRARRIADPDEIAGLRGLGVEPSTPAQGGQLVGVCMEMVRGSRVLRWPAVVPAQSGRPAPQTAAWGRRSARGDHLSSGRPASC